MNLNDLTHQLTIMIKTISQDAELNAVETWNDWRSFWCGPLPKNGSEYYKMATVNSEITEIFRMRYTAGINPHQRVRFRCKIFEIIDVINVEEKNEELILTCKGAV